MDPSFKVISPRGDRDVNLRVVDLIDFEQRRWNEQLISDCFLDFEVNTVLSILLSEEKIHDSLVWHYSKDGH